MCPTCGRPLQVIFVGLGVCVLCYMLKEPMDKHDHPKAPKAETPITNIYATVTTSPSPAPPGSR